MTIIYDLSRLSDDVRNQILDSEKFTKWFSEFPEKLLGRNTNAKVVKGLKYGVSTAVMYMSPHKKSGYNMCPMADVAECHAPCLDEAGRGAMSTVQLSRLRKTLYFMQYRNEFLAQLKNEVRVFADYCKNKGLIAGVRLNGTTDVRWELHIWDYMVDMHYNHGVRWYDYTKIANRLIPDTKVYDLTFSYSGVEKYQKFVKTAMAMGMRIAVVFRYAWQIPTTFLGLECIDGDDSDIRFHEPLGKIVALYAKGKAVHDQSGFVVDGA